VDQNIEVGSIEVNLSPDAFHLWATHFYQSKQDVSIQGSPPVHFFLLCQFKDTTTPAADDIAQIVAYAEKMGCQEAILVYPPWATPTLRGTGG
jgi:hypothetical protein